MFTGHGQVTTSGQAIQLAPERATAPGSTHAGLVVSAPEVRELHGHAHGADAAPVAAGRGGDAAPLGGGLGALALHLQPELLRPDPGTARLGAVEQDPAYRGAERFLASGRTPGFPVGRAHQVQITQTGPTITVRADGHLLTRFTDTQRPYLTGSLGLYCEDSVARFGAIHIRHRT